MLKSNRIHEEQIESISRAMKELYHVRRTELPVLHTNRFRAGAIGCAGLGVSHQANPSAGTLPENQCDGNTISPAGLSQRNLPAIRCLRCGDAFPVTDFLYTKKTGLCILCWEAKIKVA